MIVELYKTSDDVNVVNKYLTSELQFVNVTFHDEKNILNGSLTLKTNINLSEYNYMYIEKFNRYYFINAAIGTTNLWTIDYKVDVLMSFKEQLKNLTCTIKRNENIRNGYIIDSEYTALSYKKVVTKQFPNGLNNDSIVLLTVGN